MCIYCVKNLNCSLYLVSVLVFYCYCFNGAKMIDLEKNRRIGTITVHYFYTNASIRTTRSIAKMNDIIKIYCLNAVMLTRENCNLGS